MKFKNQWFSLIEVIVAGIILTIAVFGVFKLIWENQKLINNSDSYKTTTSLFIPFTECIKNIWYSWFPDKTIWKNYHINFWINLKECNIWTATPIIIDNIEYNLSWKVIEYQANKFIKFKLKIDNNFLNLEKDYKLLKW